MRGFILHKDMCRNARPNRTTTDTFSWASHGEKTCHSPKTKDHEVRQQKRVGKLQQLHGPRKREEKILILGIQQKSSTIQHTV